VNVTDLGRADAFYTEVLGLKKIPRPDLLVDGVWYELPDGRQVHLIVRPEAGSLRGTTRIDSREAHLALAVRDWEGAVEAIRAKGIEIDARVTTRTGWKQAYITDPDGNVIELTGVE